MKKIVLLLFVVCAAVSMNAQVYVGGTAGFWRTDKNDADQTQFDIKPEIGYNLSDKWAIGAELGYTYFKNGSGDYKSNTFKVAPYARFTYLESGIVRLFLDGGVGYSTTKVDDADRENGFEIGIKPGVALKLTDKFSLIAKFGFAGYRDDYTAEDIYSGATNGAGLSLSGEDLSFGFQLNF